jgi:hypothetical protein
MKKLFLIFIVFGFAVALEPTGAWAKCSGSEWTYKASAPGNNKNAIGCDCDEDTDNYTIAKKAYGFKTSFTGDKTRCAFPKYSICEKSGKNWSGCKEDDGPWLAAGVTIPTDTNHVKHVDTDSGWTWKCDDGYEQNPGKTGCQKKCDVGEKPIGDNCVADAAACATANGWVNSGKCEVCTGGKKPVGNACKFPLGPDQGYDTDGESPVNCPTLKHVTGNAYQKVVDSMCVKCLEQNGKKRYLKNESQYDSVGEKCSSVKVFSKDKILECSRTSASDDKFNTCLSNATNDK